MSDDLFSKLNIKATDFDFSKILKQQQPAIPDFTKTEAYKQIVKEQDEKHQRELEERQSELEFREAMLATLKGIEKNTALLTEMTTLLQKSNEKRDETFQLMIEILEIMKSKNPEEANNKFMGIMEKIKTFTDHASTVQSLIGMATTVYNALPFN
ncbi:hypothetical protein [Neobacillus cucumis]|uniref:hypothetical protein n=1 Tax=Neobacillus cucumis TaxID=1740721 RepID=UPI0028532E29|nr:hypothetical protein [Neobacillus cucumis]MDR4946501.1 hypothetical protein [Neobacillus cucumis]